jgi:hypothetical protein
VVGDLKAGPLFTAKVGGSHTVAAYSSSIQQMATRGDAMVASLTGYQVTIGESR